MIGKRRSACAGTKAITNRLNRGNWKIVNNSQGRRLTRSEPRKAISSPAVLSAVCAVSFLATSAQAATLNVPAQYAGIQQAIDASTDGDTVLIAPGTYPGQINFRGKAITVTSRGGPSNTIVDAMGAGNVVVFDSGETQSSEISGLTFQNGAGNFGAGIIVIGASPHIVGNVFHSNVEGVGGSGAGIGGAGSPLIEKNLFYANSCSANDNLSGVISLNNGSQPIIVNNVFRDNVSCAAVNVTVQDGISQEVTNNTMVGNMIGIYVDSRTGMQHQLLRNNIIVGNQVGIEDEFSDSIGRPDCENNLVFNNGTNYQGMPDQTGSNGNISADPMFAGQTQNNFHLTAGSPAIDSGDENSMPPLPTEDFDSILRPIDGNGDGVAKIDLGAFEFNPAASNLPLPTSQPSSTGGGGSMEPVVLALLSVLTMFCRVDRLSRGQGRSGMMDRRARMFRCRFCRPIDR
jgi:serine protease